MSGDHNPGPDFVRKTHINQIIQKRARKPKRVKLSKTKNATTRKLFELLQDDFSESSLSADSSSLSSNPF
nr:ORF3 [Torque teno felis virus]QYD01965.1 ORF3 [Torque teno felis virus]